LPATQFWLQVGQTVFQAQLSIVNVVQASKLHTLQHKA
jgi:hypothetical protein